MFEIVINSNNYFSILLNINIYSKTFDKLNERRSEYI